MNVTETQRLPRHYERKLAAAEGIEEVAAAPSLQGRTLMKALFTIPTGLLPKAQGCALRATLGNASTSFRQPQRGCVISIRSGGRNPVGVDANGYRLPRVARGAPTLGWRSLPPWGN